MVLGRYRAQPFLVSVLLTAAFWWTGAAAQAPAGAAGTEPSEQLAPEQQRAAATWQAALAAMKHGPDSVALRDQARLNLPEGFGFVPKAEGTAVMEMMGNRVDDRFIGLVFPLEEDSDFFVTLDFEDAGYIKDDEAAEWDADGLLQNLKDGTEAANEERERRGIDPIKVTRWVEPPHYDKTTHQLVWSAEAVLKNGVDPDPTINYNTYVLGREGFVSADLITTASTVEADRRVAAPVLAAVSFNDGKRYEDFNSSTDKIAAYGLTALIGGLAAKKLGLFAVLAAFAVKFAKVIVVGVVAFGAAARRFLFGSKAVAN
jgi:uncharacterized membrane-anchored protein